jgi:hypothetical protein
MPTNIKYNISKTIPQRNNKHTLSRDSKDYTW